MLTAVLALLAVAVAAVAIVLATAPTSTKVTLRNVVENEAQKSAGALRQLVEENTK